MASRSKKKIAHIGATLRTISPLTETQRDVFDAYEEGYNLLLYGWPGTGKSFLSLYLALRDLQTGKGNQSKILIFRSTVPQREVGFLPGTLEEKVAQYEEPYIGIVNELYGSSTAYNDLKTKEIIEFHSTSFNRGMTFDNSIIIVDECQNMTFQELSTLITRCGKNTRIIFCGDDFQTDLYRNKYDTSGLKDFTGILDTMESFDIIEFEKEDCVRSGICKEFLLALEAYRSSRASL